MPKPNVLMVEPLGKGGITHYAYNLANSLSEKDIRVILVTSAQYELAALPHRFAFSATMFRFSKWLEEHFDQLSNSASKVSVVLRRAVKVAEYPLSAVRALSAASNHSCILVHFQSVNWIELFMVSLFRLFRYPIVFTVHNINPCHRKPRFYHHLLFSKMYRLCDRLITHTNEARQIICKQYGLSPAKVAVIPHGDYTFFRTDPLLDGSEAKKSLGLRPDSKTILFFGSIRHSKGLDLLLRALPQVKERIANLKLIIVGEPWEPFDKYQKIIDRLGLQQHLIKQLRYVDIQELPSYFKAADVVALPYREITQSGVLQVAYAFAKPVVATRVGGFVEAVEDGRNGFLVPLGNDRELAQKIATILEHPLLARRMGDYSWSIANQRYSWSDIADTTLRLYSTLAASPFGQNTK